MSKWTVEMTDKAKAELKGLLTRQEVNNADVKVL